MHRKIRLTGTLLALLWLSSYSHSAIVTEDFSIDPAWTAVGSGANGNDFGYQTSAHAGGTNGEIGGRFTRSNFQRYIADTTLGGPLGIDDRLAASGRLGVTDLNFPDFGPGLILGYFDTTLTFGGQRVGLLLNQQNDALAGFYVDLLFQFADGSFIRERLLSDLTMNQNRLWSFEWDPNGGSLGGGIFTGSLSGPGGGSASIELTAAERLTKQATFDAFGMSSGATSGLSGNPNRSDWYADLYVDDLQYTDAAVPESTSLLVWSILAFAGTGFAWRRYRRRPRVGEIIGGECYL